MFSTIVGDMAPNGTVEHRSVFTGLSIDADYPEEHRSACTVDTGWTPQTVQGTAVRTLGESQDPRRRRGRADRSAREAPRMREQVFRNTSERSLAGDGTEQSVPRGVPCSVSSLKDRNILPEWMPPTAACHPACRWLDLVVGLVGLGYAPVPLGPEKRPLVKWGAYHVTPPTWRELYNEFPWADALGAGLVTGRPHGLVVVDADDEASWSWALENLPAVRGVRTRRGGHLHFAHPERGIVGNRSGERAVLAAPGVRLDVKGLAGMATGPYSVHPSGHVYQPLGNWTLHVRELPILPDVIARLATDPPTRAKPSPPPPAPTGSDPERAIEAYLRKAGGIPDEGKGSDEAVFRAASWAKANVPELSERAFIAAIRRERPKFAEQWVASKWRSARGR